MVYIDQIRISYFIKEVYDILPMPVNLKLCKSKNI